MFVEFHDLEQSIKGGSSTAKPDRQDGLAFHSVLACCVHDSTRDRDICIRSTLDQHHETSWHLRASKPSRN